MSRGALAKNMDKVKFDESDLYKIYKLWPDHFTAALRVSSKSDRETSYYRSVIICGMGGSGTVCDVLNDLLETYGTIPSMALGGKIIPSYINKHTLVIINSVSGNTSEAILSMKQAIRKKADVICVSSGGKLKESCIKYGFKHITIPKLSHSRASFPYLLIPGLKIINNFLTRSLSDDMLLLSKNLLNVYDQVSSNRPYKSNIAKQLAAFMNNSLVFCLTSPSLVSAGTRLKNSLNENSKVHCISDSILEASHNEVVPFTYDIKSIYRKTLLLSRKYDIEMTKERFRRVRSLLRDLDHPVFEIQSPHKNLINSIVCSIYLLDIATIYLAALRKIDPSPTPAIDILKEI